MWFLVIVNYVSMGLEMENELMLLICCWCWYLRNEINYWKILPLLGKSGNKVNKMIECIELQIIHNAYYCWSFLNLHFIQKFEKLINFKFFIFVLCIIPYDHIFQWSTKLALGNHPASMLMASPMSWWVSPIVTEVFMFFLVIHNENEHCKNTAGEALRDLGFDRIVILTVIYVSFSRKVVCDILINNFEPILRQLI